MWKRGLLPSSFPFPPPPRLPCISWWWYLFFILEVSSHAHTLWGRGDLSLPWICVCAAHEKGRQPPPPPAHCTDALKRATTAFVVFDKPLFEELYGICTRRIGNVKIKQKKQQKSKTKTNPSGLPYFCSGCCVRLIYPCDFLMQMLVCIVCVCVCVPRPLVLSFQPVSPHPSKTLPFLSDISFFHNPFRVS